MSPWEAGLLVALCLLAAFVVIGWTLAEQKIDALTRRVQDLEARDAVETLARVQREMGERGRTMIRLAVAMREDYRQGFIQGGREDGDKVHFDGQDIEMWQ